MKDSIRYAALKTNDIVDCEYGICVSFWVQGCPIRCKGCHNMQTWNEHGGEQLPEDILTRIDNALEANGIDRSFSVLGGEPFAAYNLELTLKIISHVRDKYPNKTIYCWTGYTYDQLKNIKEANKILEKINVLIEGPFIEEEKDISLKMRGSTNQKIHYLN